MLSKREKIVFSLLITIVIVSFLYLLFALYYANTKEIPTKGGVYREGVVESTQWLTINPLYSIGNDTERDIAEVVFDGLFYYNEEGELMPGLAKDLNTEDHKVFDLHLKEDLYWSDGEKITSEDVKFTVKTILNPDFGSPLRQEWDGVGMEKISKHQIRFTLGQPSAVFPENLTLKIIPKHIFKELSPRDFRYSINNMKPVGSGPYRFKETEKRPSGEIRSITFERNPYYHGLEAFIDEVSFVFFDNEEDVYRAKARGEIDGYAISGNSKEYSFEDIRGTHYYSFDLPRYFSVTFNLESENAIGNKGVRKALTHATDKEAILENVLNGKKGEVVNSPFFAEFYDLPVPENGYHYDIEKGKKILEEEGFENGKRTPEDPFEFTEEMKEESQGEEVRKLQECFIYLREEDEDLYPQGEVTGFFDEGTKEAVNYFQEKYREEILDPHGFTRGTGMVAGSTQKKLNEKCKDLFGKDIFLEVSLTTLEDPLLVKTAKELKEQWERLGVKVEIKEKSFSDIQERTIRERDFEVLLFGTMLSRSANPFPLWHSSKTETPGLNLSGYQNEEADELLEKILHGEKEGEEVVVKLQEMIMEEAPTISLYSPYFKYSVSNKVEGIEERKLANPSDRLSDINRWHINARRILK